MKPVLTNYIDLFKWGEGEVGTMSNVEHIINTKEQIQIKSKQYRMPYNLREEMS